MSRSKYKKKNDKAILRRILTLLILGACWIVLNVIGNYISLFLIDDTPEEVSTVTIVENSEAILLASKEKGIEANVYIQVNFGDQAEIGSGTIFLADESYYYALTNAHVLDANGNVVDTKLVTTSDGVSTDFEVIASDEEKDLAVIKFDRLTRTEIAPINFGSNNIIVDSMVVTVGNPYGNIGTVSYGSILRNTYLQELEITRSVIEHDAILSNGSSGGALLDIYGNLIGINTWRLDSYYYAIPLSVIHTFLEENNI